VDCRYHLVRAPNLLDDAVKLNAVMVPYSGTVGGGLRLLDEKGRARFLVAIMGTDRGITKEQTAAIATALIKGIPEPIEVPDAETKPRHEES
jgi:hypothetical protein